MLSVQSIVTSVTSTPRVTVVWRMKESGYHRDMRLFYNQALLAESKMSSGHHRASFHQRVIPSEEVLSQRNGVWQREALGAKEDWGAKTKTSLQEFLGDLVVKDSVLSLLWHRFDPWPGNFCILQTKTKTNKKTHPLSYYMQNCDSWKGMWERWRLRLPMLSSGYLKIKAFFRAVPASSKLFSF